MDAPPITDSWPSPPRPVAAVTSWLDSWAPTVVLVLAVTLLRLVYLAFFCPYTLLEDEAHYWEWGRRPGWSYYSKGPGIAWSVGLSTGLLGDSEFAVRLPAVAFGAAGALAVAWLARVVTGERRAGFFAAACLLLTPGFQLGGILLTVDMPYAACWAVGAVCAWRALSGESARAWGALGLALGVGFLFKYTILLLIPGLLLYALLARRRDRVVSLTDTDSRSVSRGKPRDQEAPQPGPSVAAATLRSGVPRVTPWIAMGVLLFGACTLPVIIWNARHDWPTVRHLLGHGALPGGDMPVEVNGVPVPPREMRPVAWFLEFLGTQGALIGPVLVLMALAIARALRVKDDPARAGLLYLICAGAPILLGYGVLSFWVRVEGNWPIAGYVTLFALAGWALAHQGSGVRSQGSGSGAKDRMSGAIRSTWMVSLACGVVFAMGALRLDWIDAFPGTRVLERALFGAGLIPEGRRLVPMPRLTGARAMAGDAAALGERLGRETGLEPFFVGEHYGRAGLLAFYLPGRRVVYCSSSQRGEGRRTQYDYWPDTDLGDLTRLGGRPAVLIGSKLERWRVAFERVEPVGRLPNETKRDRQTFLGIGYRGFGEPGSGARDGGSGR